MELSVWFYLAFFLAVLGTAFAGWGTARGWGWGWSVPFVLVLLMLLILGLRVFGGPVKG